MNTKIAALAAVMATVLVFANSAYADSALDKSMVAALEKKQAKESKALIAKLQNYKQTLKDQDLSNKATEDRVNQSFSETKLKIDQIVDLLKNGRTAENPENPDAKVELIQAEKVRAGTPGGTDILRVTYKVTAGKYEIQNAKVVIESNGKTVSNNIHGLLPWSSATHTIFVKGGNPDSLSIRLG